MGSYAPRACLNCGMTVVHAHGRCAPCARYFERMGEERPEGLIVRLARRKLEERLANALRAQRICGDVVFIGPEAWTECERAPGHLGKRHRSWLGEWTWAGSNLQFSLGHDYAREAS